MRPLVVLALMTSIPAVGVALGMWDVLASWPGAGRVLGWRRSVALAWLMTRIRHRMPFRAMRLSAPACTSAAPLLAGSWLLATWSGSPGDPALYAGALAVVAAIMSFLIVAAPPTVLFLGASQYEEFRVMKRVHVEARCYVLSLVNQMSLSVLRQYDAHYASVRTGMPAPVRAIARAMAPAVDPTAPRIDSIRTRTGFWQQTVLELIERVPIVLIDARAAGRLVQQEALWTLAAGRHKAIFICNDDGSAPLLDELRRLGVTLQPRDAQVLSEDDACDAIERTIHLMAPRSPVANSQTDDPLVRSLARAEEVWQHMGETYQTLLTRICEGNQSDRELDAAIWQAAGLSQSDGADAAPPFTASLDVALGFAHHMLNRRPGRYSYRIDIDTDGAGSASIGVQDRPGNLLVFESSALSPPRAVLHALFQALLA